MNSISKKKEKKKIITPQVSSTCSRDINHQQNPVLISSTTPVNTAKQTPCHVSGAGLYHLIFHFQAQQEKKKKRRETDGYILNLW